MNNLWIRSQDKEQLIKIDNVYYSEGHLIYTCDTNDNGILLGRYSTKERALKVLDEIQDHIIHQGEKYIDFEHGGYIYINVYQMPKN